MSNKIGSTVYVIRTSPGGNKSILTGKVTDAFACHEDEFPIPIERAYCTVTLEDLSSVTLFDSQVFSDIAEAKRF